MPSFSFRCTVYLNFWKVEHLYSYSTDRHLLQTFKDLEELVTKGDRVFAARTPQLLNSLPEDLRQATHFYHLALYNC